MTLRLTPQLMPAADSCTFAAANLMREQQLELLSFLGQLTPEQFSAWSANVLRWTEKDATMAVEELFDLPDFYSVVDALAWLGTSSHQSTAH